MDAKSHSEFPAGGNFAANFETFELRIGRFCPKPQILAFT
jgi:hypothetical protein